MERHKARLLNKGLFQRSGSYLEKSYAAVITDTIVRMMMALMVLFWLKVMQVDVNFAVLNGNSEEELYICQPVGFSVDKHGKPLCGSIRRSKVFYMIGCHS